MKLFNPSSLHPFILSLLTIALWAHLPLRAEVYEVPLTQSASSANVYVEVDIDGLPALFAFDTGCSDVSLSRALLQQLIDQGQVRLSDLKDAGDAQLANGKLSKANKMLLLRELRLGGYTFRNVVASVGLDKIHDAPLLLGQSVLERMRFYYVSNGTLRFEPLEDDFQQALVAARFYADDTTRYDDIALRLLPYEQDNRLTCFYQSRLYHCLAFTGRYQQAHRLASKMLLTHCMEEDELTEQELRLYCNEAVTLYNAERYDEALTVFQTAWPMALDFRTRDNRYVQHLGNLAWHLYMQLDDPSRAAPFRQYRK
jgi:tetratricopeptide (TPR) repeat protein